MTYADSNGVFGKIGGAYDIGGFFQVRINLFPAQSVVSQCDDVNATLKQIVGGFGSNSVSLCRIFTIGDYYICLVLFF